MSLLAAILVGACAWAVGRRAFGGPVASHRFGELGLRLSAAGRNKSERPSFQVWLSQAGAAVTPRQFWAVSAGVGAAAFVLFVAISRTVVVSALPALALAATPYAYWSSQRQKQAAARSGAWPDALRYMVGALGAGIATLHDALEDLAKSGPEPLRAPMARYVRLSRASGTEGPWRPFERTWRTLSRTRSCWPSRAPSKRGQRRSSVCSRISVRRSRPTCN